MSSPSGFQNQINLVQAPAVAGDLASNNPRASVDAGPGGLVAGTSGVNVGLFAWIASDNTTVNNFGSPSAGAPRGFVHREQQALIQNYLQTSSMSIPQGFPVTLDNAGDFWAVNNGPNSSNINDVIYARYSDGAIFCASAPNGASATGSIGSTNTALIGSTSTGTGSGTNLTLSSLTGLVSIGDTVSGTGVPAGTTIVSQTSGTTGAAGVYVTSQATTASSATITTFGTVLDVTSTTGYVAVGDTVSGGTGFPVAATITSQISGTPNGVGLYRLSAPATAYVASATGVTTFGNTLNVTAVASGVFAVGDPVSGTGVPANAVIASQLTGTVGSTGIYTLGTAATAYAASTALTVVAGVATSWKAKSIAAVGELVKISTWG